MVLKICFVQVFLLGLDLSDEDNFLSVEQHSIEIGYKQTFSICGLVMECFFMVYRTVWFPEALCYLHFDYEGWSYDLGE